MGGIPERPRVDWPSPCQKINGPAGGEVATLAPPDTPGTFIMTQDGIEFLDEDLETYPDGTVKDGVLAADCEIQGLPCAGGNAAVFHPGGQLRLAWLARRTVIGGVPCAAGILYLHPDGTVFNATLSADHTWDDVEVKAGSRVTLANGCLHEYSTWLTEDDWLGGYHCSAQFYVWRYWWGDVSRAVLASATVIGETEFPRGTEVILDAVGEMREGFLHDLDSGTRKKQHVFGGGIGDVYQEA